jgi:hypothetical protein
MRLPERCPACGRVGGIDEKEHPRGGTSWWCGFCQAPWNPLRALAAAERRLARVEGLAREWEERGNASVHFMYHEQHAADSAEADTYARCAEVLAAALADDGGEATTKGDTHDDSDERA